MNNNLKNLLGAVVVIVLLLGAIAFVIDQQRCGGVFYGDTRVCYPYGSNARW